MTNTTTLPADWAIERAMKARGYEFTKINEGAKNND